MKQQIPLEVEAPLKTTGGTDSSATIAGFTSNPEAIVVFNSAPEPSSWALGLTAVAIFVVILRRRTLRD